MHFDKDHSMHGMRTWLIQRLQKALPPRVLSNGAVLKDNPFSFGGGYKNGGLSDKAMDMFRSLFGFDYMGAAEFEFGEVPKAFQKIAAAAEKKELITYTIDATGEARSGIWKDKKSTAKITKRLYVVCPKTFENKSWDAKSKEVDGKAYTTEIVLTCIKKEHPDLKESTRLHDSLFQVDPEYIERGMIGWLELDNGFAFFSDKEVFVKFCALFGVEYA